MKYEIDNMKKLGCLLLIILGLSSCIERDPNLNKEGKDILESLVYLDSAALSFYDTVYVPIYSDIYDQTQDSKTLLTATLSIRNTSLRDSIYISDIDYYDSRGTLVRQYIERIILLHPLQSIEYVIEFSDNTGGTGANFIVNWGATQDKLRPIFQGVMISKSGQQGLSFVTEGVSISKQ